LYHIHIENIITSYDYLPPSFTDERGKVFSRNKKSLEVPSWYTHTPLDGGFNVFMYLKKFCDTI